ncbi:MAG: dihydroneopterin aldolase [Spirochaetales bacterium]|nr:dihydroneopterin aldolase [Spirochaetales bacterium]
MDLRDLDKIHISDLLLRCIIGINPDERVKKQDVVINITLYSDLSAACISDSIEETIDYGELKNKVVAMIEPSSFCLIEKMAEEISRICLSTDGVVASKVKVEKPGALRLARTVGIEITRTKEWIKSEWPR